MSITNYFKKYFKFMFEKYFSSYKKFSNDKKSYIKVL